MALQINRASIAYEDFEDELVIIHLEKGFYFSLNETGVRIWHRLEKGPVDVDGMLQALMTELQEDERDLLDGAKRFLGELEREDLLVEAGNERVPEDDLRTFQIDLHVPPSITKYSDIQDILTLDPLHEVTPLGWPHAEKK